MAATALKRQKHGRQYKLLIMALPFMLLVFFFNYIPIFGWIYSVFDYVPGVPLSECDFMGADYFKLMLQDANVLRTLKNTAVFAVISIVLSPLPMLFAILLNEIKNGPVRRFVQTFTTLPNFISWVIIFSLAFSLFSSDGLLTGLFEKLGMKGQSLLSIKDAVYGFQTFLSQWKTLGWSSIIYLAAIAGIDQEQYEAARVDGCNRFQCFWKVVFPLMTPINVTQLVLNTLFIWNDYSTSIILLRKKYSFTLTLAQIIYFNENTTMLNEAFAFFIMAMIPILILYLCMQKYIVSGITAGAVKG